MKKRTFKRGVALLLVTVMMMAMFGVSAFADGESADNSLYTSEKSVTIKQVVTVDANENVPGATFKYSIVGDPAAPVIEDVVFDAVERL